MNDKRLLTPSVIALLKTWAANTTLEEELLDDEDDPRLEDMDVNMAHVQGIRDGKTELARDILEAQDLINYN